MAKAKVSISKESTGEKAFALPKRFWAGLSNVGKPEVVEGRGQVQTVHWALGGDSGR